ncbi:hypothetical protein LP420_20750 [Massilia sp. B-10]|nr:hypothetical protein LP420_20750 [Massilia sp. B-10]
MLTGLPSNFDVQTMRVAASPGLRVGAVTTLDAMPQQRSAQSRRGEPGRKNPGAAGPESPARCRGQRRPGREELSGKVGRQ